MSLRRHNNSSTHLKVVGKTRWSAEGATSSKNVMWRSLQLPFTEKRPLTEPIISELEDRLASTVEALRLVEERAVAGRFALEVMHEIKNPLEALGHLTFLAAEEADHPEKVRKYMSLAEEQMATLTHIARQTLGIARISNVPKPVDLAALVEAALRIHQRAIEFKGIRLIKGLPGGMVVAVYTGEMLQVLSNVIVNALDALTFGGTLSVRLRRRRSEVQFVIADNGHGIPAAHRAEIFEPFFTTKEERGNGLGLSLTKKIIERHRGKIFVRSSIQPGKSGTIFKISVPSSVELIPSTVELNNPKLRPLATLKTA
jgi:signal transduction histidine kinase